MHTTGEEEGKNGYEVSPARGFLCRNKCGDDFGKRQRQQYRGSVGLGGNICGVFSGRRLLILETAVGRRRNVKRDDLTAVRKEAGS